MNFISTQSDDTAALNAAFASNQKVVLQSGCTYRIDGTVTAPLDGSNLVIEHGATVIHKPTAMSCFEFLGAGSLVNGHGKIISEGARNATNEEATYGVIVFKGEESTARDVRLKGVPKVGVKFKDAGSGEVIDVRINGLMPYSEWTGINTAHFGVFVDPDNSVHQGRVSIRGGVIEGCVSGVVSGNFQEGGLGRGLLVNGVRFSNCHDHGVYADKANGAVLTGNNFDECCVAVVAGGDSLTVSGNGMTNLRRARGILDRPGISVRDATNSNINGNTVIGEFGQAGYVAIAVDSLEGTVLRGNNLIGNIITNNGQYQGGAIRLGSDLTEVSEFNTLTGNIVDGMAGDWDSLIRLGMKAGYLGYGNALNVNQIISRNQYSALSLNNQVGLHMTGNRIEMLHNADAPAYAFMCALDTVLHSTFTSNKFSVGFAGANMHVRAFNSLNSHNNAYGKNRLLATAAGVLSATGVYNASPSCEMLGNFGSF